MNRGAPSTEASPFSATLFGFGAILLWSLLAVIIIATGAMPPFQLTAITFAIGALVNGAILLPQSGLGWLTRLRLIDWLHGAGGLFGYHALYFFALRHAPPAQAGLLNYLWPLLIVLFSGSLPGHALRAVHVLGALVAFAGTGLLFAGREQAAVGLQYWPGFAAAFAAAFVWATYSVASRFLRGAPPAAIVPYCLLTAIFSAISHVLFEQTIWPETALQWAALVALGLGPAGIAFVWWQRGMQHGHVRTLGAAAYAAPLISTALLMAFGHAQASLTLALAAILVVGGGWLAGRR